MIHTFTISYELSLKDANTCTYRLNEHTKAFTGFRLTEFLDVKRKFGRLSFKNTKLPGMQTITLLKFTDRNNQRIFRIYFQIEAEVLRTGTDTLDLFFASPEHAKQIQIQYARAIYSLFPEAFTGRPASHLAKSGFAEPGSYAPEEYINGMNNNGHGGLYSLPYLPLGSVKRIDFTIDHISPDEKIARVFTEMVSISYYDGWKKKVYIGKNKNESSKEKSYDKAYASKFKTFSIYYKYDKMCSPEYNGRPNIAQIREDSRCITRIEMPFKSPNRETIKSLTWLQIPDEAISLGPLPYLATENIALHQFELNYLGRIGNFYDLKWYTRDGLDKRVNKLIRDKALKKGAGKKIIKLTQSISKRGSLTNYIKALKKYQRNKDKTKDNNKEKTKKLFPTMKTLMNYKALAMKNGMMLTTIPAIQGITELSALPRLRKFDFSEMNGQMATYMLPYQSVAEVASELEPVKDLYDSILSFLYGLYDEYSSRHNAMVEAAKLSPEEVGL